MVVWWVTLFQRWLLARQNISKRVASKAESGARARKTLWRDRWIAYWAHHRRSAVDSLQRLKSSAVQTAMTWLVIAVALSLPAFLLLGLDNLQQLGQRWDGAPSLTLFLDTRAKPEAIDTLQADLRADPQVESLEFVSPEQALLAFEQNTGLGEALRLLDSNPLPASFIVVPEASVSPEQLVVWGESVRSHPIVEDVVYDRAWIERLHRLLQLGRQLVWVLGVLLCLGVCLVIGNTIRLAIENRRDEIVIIKLVGGSSAFVRRPFLYTGFWYGFGGGLIGFMVLVAVILTLSGPVSDLAIAYESQFRLGLPGIALFFGMVFGGGAVGWLGAWLAVGRHLGEIEPR